jgi:pimeloyl-ACP methyl ester carboxylesterase
MPTFRHQGRTLHYLDEGAGPPVLLLHAFPLCAAMFRPQVDALGSRFRFLLPDLRGFGHSDVDPEPVTMTDFADDALALLDHLGVEQAAVGGVSMGGYVALALLRTDPSRVRALILSDTQLLADDEAVREKREQTAQALLARGAAVLEEILLPRLLGQPAAPEVEDRVRALIRSTSARGAASATRGMAQRADARDILGRFAGPLLVMVGEKDAITPLSRAQELADRVRGAQLVQIPGAGHLPNLEAPAAFNAALERFLSALRP